MSEKPVQQLYDNSNLAESYSGVVSPLTASFARDLYEGVYRNFASFMGVSKRNQERYDAIFPSMIVTIGYHLYYDLRNWYRLISLLPGYSYNKAFFEHMLGVTSAGFVEGIDEQVQFPTFLHRVVGISLLLFQGIKVASILIIMPFSVYLFNRRFDRVFRDFNALPLDRMSFDELRSHYLNVRKDLVRLWRVPIANDFGVMISVGIARRLHQKYEGDDNFVSSLRLNSQSNLATLDPGRMLFRIAEKIQENTSCKSLFEGDSTDTDVYAALVTTYSDTDIFRMITEYILLFGSRVPNELKLETQTLTEAPYTVVQLIRSVSSFNKETLGKRLKVSSSANVSLQASPVSKMTFLQAQLMRVVIAWARKSIQNREATRLRRSQIFGHARQVFLKMGAHLAAQGLLSKDEDVMFLSATELCNANTMLDIQNTIKIRRGEMEKWKLVRLPTRIETVKNIPDIEAEVLQQKAFSSDAVAPTAYRGVVASRGGVESMSGIALVLKEFDPKIDYSNKILVTKHTDPGWTIAFALVKAIIVERGGILSHASIVAREMNVPCIIGFSDATDKIATGMNITLNLIDGSVVVNS